MSAFEVCTGEWCLSTQVGNLPSIYSSYVEHADLVDEFELRGAEGTPLFLSVGRNESRWPEFIHTQRFESELGYNPGALIVPERSTLFVGAGTRLLAYDLAAPKRLWEDYADAGFRSWRRHEDAVLMSAELELAAWDTDGRKRWSAMVEPPWDYAVRGGTVELDVMGKLSTFLLESGPA